MIPVWQAGNINGKIIIQDKDRFDMYLSTLPEIVNIVVSKHKKRRSGNQNRYYHSVVVRLISDETGYSTDEVHELLKMMFNSTIVNVGKNEIKIAKSTASLTTTEFELYISKCIMWASQELSLIIPNPERIKE